MAFTLCILMYLILVFRSTAASNEELEPEFDEITLNVTFYEPVDANDAFKYEITENVVDVPDKATKSPIDTDFALAVPLNNATLQNSSNNIENYYLIDTDKDKNEIANPRTKYLSILHIKADFNDHNRIEMLKPIVNAVNPIKIVGNAVHGLQEYINAVRNGIFNNVNGINGGQFQPNGNNVVYIPNIVAGPVLFLNKLQRKTADAAGRFRDALFGK